jgi:hypothetical protein
MNSSNLTGDKSRGRRKERNRTKGESEERMRNSLSRRKPAWVPDASIREIRLPLKTEPSTIQADDGTQIEHRDIQSKKALDSIRFNRDPASKTTDPNARQVEKQSAPRTETEGGIAIDVRWRQNEKASAPISRNLDSPSKRTC